MNAHTPGPWHIGLKPGPTIYGPKGEQVADMIVPMIGIVEHSANARLIAAAPGLLFALESLESAVTHYFRDFEYLHPDIASPMKVARAAIAKARGEL